nr:MATE family efflux transporter [uncultured Roseococcus sp.]
MSEAALSVTPASVTPAAGRPPLDQKARARAALLDGPILATLLRLALPTVSVLIAQTAVNVAEGYYVGLLGTDALAGVTLVFPVYMLMMMMSGGGLGSGVASSVARAVGAGRQRDADALVLHAIVLAIIVGGLFTWATIQGGPWLYHLLGGRGEALEAALVYSNWIFAGSIAIWIVNLLAAALRGAGNVKVPALVTLFGALVMIPASPALIFGFGPIPHLGIAGAGLAFALYFGGAALALLWYMSSRRGSLTLRWARLEWRLFADILKVGLPTAVSTVLTNLTVILVTGAMGLFGTQALAGYGVASRLDYLLIPVLFGLSSAVLTMVGVNIGAGRRARAREAAWTGALVGAAFTGVVGLVVAFRPELWTHLFTQDPEVLAPAALYLGIVAPAYGLFGLGFVLSFAGQGAGHMFWPLLGVAGRLVVAAGLGWVAVSFLGAGIATLAAIVALSFVAYAAMCCMVMLSKATWGR